MSIQDLIDELTKHKNKQAEVMLRTWVPGDDPDCRVSADGGGYYEKESLDSEQISFFRNTLYITL